MNINAKKALQQLQIGYQRYSISLSMGSITYPLSLCKLDEHKPIAAIVSCSDARVVPEYLFGQPPGQLFGVRVVGNIVDACGLASLEFAVKALQVPLIIVLGHRGCGAIQAVLENLIMQNPVPMGYLGELIKTLKPIINAAQTPLNHSESVSNQAILHNVQHNVRVIQQAQPLIAQYVIDKKVHVIGAIYCPQKGDLKFIESNDFNALTTGSEGSQ